MTSHGHIVVWIDHRAARIFDFDRSDATRRTVRHWEASRQVHHRAGAIGNGHIPEDRDYLRDVADALAGAREILIVGRSHVKYQLKAYLNLHAPEISRRVMAVEHADHPSDRQIVAHARKYFAHADRIMPQWAASMV